MRETKQKKRLLTYAAILFSSTSWMKTKVSPISASGCWTNIIVKPNVCNEVERSSLIVLK